MNKPSRFAASAAGALAVFLVLSGCTTDDEAQTPSSSTTVTQPNVQGSVPAGFEKAYEQTVTWEKCSGAFECATIQAPLDWNDPASETIDVAVQMYNARSGSPLGTVLINPGGPGGSGLELVEYAPIIFGKDLLDNYNILGFDPRGVGKSTPVSCYEPKDMDRYLALSFPTVTEKVLPVLQKEADAYAQACKENSGPILEFVDTQSVARDMDLMRALVGDEKLNYLGYSYGTELGAIYAGLFPDNVGRMVLDGALDLRISDFEKSKQQAVGFENALRAFVADCQKGSECVLTGSVDDGMKQVADFLDLLGTNPLPTDTDRVLTQSLGTYAVLQPLYAEALWKDLRAALEQAINAQDGTLLLASADSYFDREPDGTYASNKTEAFAAVHCLDPRGTSDFETMSKEAEQILAAAPTMGKYFGFGGVACKNWPYPVAEQKYDLAAKGAAPIMVIGTTNDPATPYVWAEGLTEQLESAFLVTHVGEGHTVYGTGDACIQKTVDEFFVDGTIPKEGLRCE
ncbi:alpha/beta hydrolase [Timonella sp. A28]|uniref:alpha/beta hydrolase n=1 Tax=Timonella sp. A28 TaxID=3442640 RepID=UPI003EBD3EFB